MSHVCINGRNISRTWLNRHYPEIKAVQKHRAMVLKLCVLILLWDYLQIQDALDQLVREGSVRALPDGRYEAI